MASLLLIAPCRPRPLRRKGGGGGGGGGAVRGLVRRHASRWRRTPFTTRAAVVCRHRTAKSRSTRLLPLDASVANPQPSNLFRRSDGYNPGCRLPTSKPAKRGGFTGSPSPAAANSNAS
jgi:hypothetical protein